MLICRKIIIFVFLSFALLSVKSYSEVVDKVDVQGNERISLETIIIFGDITIGKNYEKSDINLLILSSSKPNPVSISWVCSPNTGAL